MNIATKTMIATVVTALSIAIPAAASVDADLGARLESSASADASFLDTIANGAFAAYAEVKASAEAGLGYAKDTISQQFAEAKADLAATLGFSAKASADANVEARSTVDATGDAAAEHAATIRAEVDGVIAQVTDVAANAQASARADAKAEGALNGNAGASSLDLAGSGLLGGTASISG